MSSSLAQRSLQDAADAMTRTIERIRGLEGDPLELIQSLEAMSAARENYIDASIDYNISQMKLLPATGTPNQ